MVEDLINQDLKTALLAGDKTTVTTLRGLKSVILYAKVASGERDKPLSDDVVFLLLQKEAKKRQESADLYVKGGNLERANAELVEMALIQGYLPKQLSQVELETIIQKVIADYGSPSVASLGTVISAVRQQTQGRADGARVVELVKKNLLP